MRFGLVACLLVGCGAAKSRSVGSFDARSSVYVDNDATTIQTHTVTIAANPTKQTSLSARRLVDFTSSASVDVTSAATERWTEFRNETEASAAYADNEGSVGGSYIYSAENDWWSHTGSLGGTRELLQKNLTLGLGGAYGTNQVGRADDDNFEERLKTYSGNTSAVIVGSPRDILKLTYVFSYLKGYQASPYRFVRFSDDLIPPDLTITQPEVLPDRRIRHALSARWNHHIIDKTVLRTHGRGYLDDWGVGSLTAGAEGLVGWRTLEFGLTVRGYIQRHATFYQDSYDSDKRYMTADRELSNFYDVFGGGRIRWKTKPLGEVVDQLRAELKFMGFGFLFPEFSRLPHREGFVAETAIGATF